MTLCPQPAKEGSKEAFLVSVAMFYMFIGGSSSFPKTPLPISLTFIHLLVDTGNRTARSNYLQRPLLLTSVGSANFKKTKKHATF